VLSHPSGPAGAEFRRIARRMVDELLPPVEMSGCTARIFEAAQANLDAKDAAAAP
jgi:ATP-binding protein involved in chromosome partitioning